MAKRDWIIDTQDYETEEDFRAAVADELARAEHSGYRLGFGIVAQPIRQRIGDGIVTRGWAFKSVTVPLVGGQQSGPVPQAPEPVEEPAAEAADPADWGDDEGHDRELLDSEPEVEPEEPAVVGPDPYKED